jgi:hypothetical protein
MFFGTYEWSKRFLIDHGLQHHLAYLSAGKLHAEQTDGDRFPKAAKLTF